MENKNGEVEFSRRSLYDEIWKISVAGVARKYDLNYADLIEVCKNADIPYPSSGYWTKLNFGKDVSSEIVPLTGNENDTVKIATKDSLVKTIRKRRAAGTETGNESGEVIITPSDDLNKENNLTSGPIFDGVLNFLEKDEKNKVTELACMLEIDENAKPHKALSKYRKETSSNSGNLKTRERNVYYGSGYDKTPEETQFFNEVSEDGKKRFVKILSAVFYAIEKLGGSVNDDLSVSIRNSFVRFRIAEGKDKIKHEITKKEAQELIEYQDKVKRDSWASKPRIRQYDYVYNGKLRIVFSERMYIRDSKTERLEDRLGDILIALYERSEENRIERERHEEERRKREEQERRREEIRKKKETEIRLTKELANKAEDYRIASEIRNYINAMILNRNEEATPEWIEWANKKADWFDPTIAREDEYLGIREHEKNKEDKKLDNNPTFRNWYW